MFEATRLPQLFFHEAYGGALLLMLLGRLCQSESELWGDLQALPVYVSLIDTTLRDYVQKSRTNQLSSLESCEPMVIYHLQQLEQHFTTKQCSALLGGFRIEPVQQPIDGVDIDTISEFQGVWPSICELIECGSVHIRQQISRLLSGRHIRQLMPLQ